jgi:hypothetical protein
MMPFDLRDAFVARVAAELRGKDLGDGLVHRVAYGVARQLALGRRRDGSTSVGWIRWVFRVDFAQRGKVSERQSDTL